MNFEISALPHFKRELKKLAKKYPSLKENFTQLLASLQQSPHQGTALGNNCHKVRMAITSKGKGKSAGSRVITYLHAAQNTLYLMTIYDKAGQETVSDHMLKQLLKHIP